MIVLTVCFHHNCPLYITNCLILLWLVAAQIYSLCNFYKLAITRVVDTPYANSNEIRQLLTFDNHLCRGAESWDDELSPDHPDSPVESSERPSTDTSFFAFYENLGCAELTENLRKDLYMEERDFESHSGSRSPVELNQPYS